MEIQSLYSLDIFIQGFFLMICLSIGFYNLFTNNFEKTSTTDSIEEFSEKISSGVNAILSIIKLENSNNKSVGGVILVGFFLIGLTFILGIMGTSVADKWIDSKPTNHLALNKLWFEKGTLSPDCGNNSDYLYCDSSELSAKETIRIRAFSNIFGQKICCTPNKTIRKNINELYHHADHEIMSLSDESFEIHVKKNRIKSEYNRVFALGFFILFVLSYLNLIFLFIRLSHSWKRSNPPVDLKFGMAAWVLRIFGMVATIVIYCITYTVYNQTWLYQNWFVLLIIFSAPVFLIAAGSIKRLQYVRFTLFVCLMIPIISLVGYIVACKQWAYSEQKVSSKVFGIYKSLHKKHTAEDENLIDSINLECYDGINLVKKQLEN